MSNPQGGQPNANKPGQQQAGTPQGSQQQARPVQPTKPPQQQPKK